MKSSYTISLATLLVLTFFHIGDAQDLDTPIVYPTLKCTTTSNDTEGFTTKIRLMSRWEVPYTVTYDCNCPSNGKPMYCSYNHLVLVRDHTEYINQVFRESSATCCQQTEVQFDMGPYKPEIDPKYSVTLRDHGCTKIDDGLDGIEAYNVIITNRDKIIFYTFMWEDAYQRIVSRPHHYEWRNRVFTIRCSCESTICSTKTSESGLVCEEERCQKPFEREYPLARAECCNFTP